MANIIVFLKYNITEILMIFPTIKLVKEALAFHHILFNIYNYLEICFIKISMCINLQ